MNDRMVKREGSQSLEDVRRSFRWQLPQRYNLGVDVADRQPKQGVAIITTDGKNILRETTFGELSESSNRLANALAAHGVKQGDRVGIMLPQRPETAIAHIAVYKLGAIAVPLSTLFGPEAVEMRLADCQPVAVIGDKDGLELMTALDLASYAIDVDRDWEQLLLDSSPHLEPTPTTPDSPALIIYTSGTTGAPKGALHAHRLLLGHLPGVELSHEFFPQPGDRFWTPADWAWIGGLYDVVMPSLHYGKPVVAFRSRHFDPDQALELMSNLDVRNTFLPPTALRMMREARSRPTRVRSVASGGESLSPDLVEWGREQFGVTINEFYGQTEANVVITNCASLWAVRPGSMGKASPGHDVKVIDGEIVVRCANDPVVFLGYWNKPEATASKVRDGWLHTDDLGDMDDDGSFRYRGRSDDVINSGGYRISPGEIEAVLAKHPKVAQSAVVGTPDALRGEAVKAFIVLRDGAEPSLALEHELQVFVKTKLAAYEYPRRVEFVEALPMTVTGKIQRSVLRKRESDKSTAGAPEKRPR
jgi:acetyl-CoA synthetase